MIQHLLERNQPLGLQSDVDHHMLVRDLDHGAGDDDLFGGQVLGGGGLGGLLAVEVRQRRGKVGRIVVRLGVRRRVAAAAWRSLLDRGQAATCRAADLVLWVEVDSEDRSVCSAVVSGARVSSSVFRGLLSVWSGLWTSTVIDALLRDPRIHSIRAALAA